MGSGAGRRVRNRAAAARGPDAARSDVPGPPAPPGPATPPPPPRPRPRGGGAPGAARDQRRHDGQPGMKTIQAYRFALDLTPSQERAALSHAGAARVAHNWALARVKAVMDQRAAERSYSVPDDLLTPSVSWSLPALRKAWNADKADVAPWWKDCSKEAFNTGLDALARALKNWSDSRSGKRAGRPVG